MNTLRCRLILTYVLSCAVVHAEDWTVNGKDYHNVKASQVEADRVHITFEGGLGTVALADLPPDLQKRFNYDPAKAKASADARARTNAEADHEMASEVVTSPNPQGTTHKMLTPQRIAAIQSEIDRAELDISKCQQKQATLTQQELLGSGWQYGEEIRQDNLRIAALRTQLEK